MHLILVMKLRIPLKAHLSTVVRKLFWVILHVLISVVVETFPRPFRDLSTCLSLEIVRYINIPTTEAIESNDLNIENC